MIEFYSPFENIKSIFDIKNLTYNDLSVLADYDEGYCIEYKSEFSKEFREKKFPKSVCAFSNRNGGWLFIGVDDKGQIKDIDLLKITEEALYSTIYSRVQPQPKVMISILENPQKKGFGVIVLYISAGRETPYIANGTVYVRNGNESVPADRSTLDTLINAGYNFTNLSLNCFGADKNEFVFFDRRYERGIIDEDIKPGFDFCVADCKRIALYLKNEGKHFDENIELTIKISGESYFDIVSSLKRFPNNKYEDYFTSFVSLPASYEITDYLSPFVINPGPLAPLEVGRNDFDYNLKYMDYLYEREYYNIKEIRTKKSVYFKILFKGINPQQKMFLPAMLLCTNSIKALEYSITSKYSLGLEKGCLKRRDVEIE